jgi:pyruvate/2-oxoglutarate dehydrogenase complex dihydrolipoamide dehydrogenase (E3) component
MHTDLLILGGGPAGYYCALQGARQGLKPILVEKDAMGGTGLRWGCLPVKYMMDRIRAYKTTPGFLERRTDSCKTADRYDCSRDHE